MKDEKTLKAIKRLLNNETERMANLVYDTVYSDGDGTILDELEQAILDEYNTVQIVFSSENSDYVVSVDGKEYKRFNELSSYYPLSESIDCCRNLEADYKSNGFAVRVIW